MAGIDKRRLRMGMIGGGPGSFIGPVHRIAAELDREIELVAGAFSSDPNRSREAGETYRVDAARAYADVAAMLAGESGRSDGIDFVSIVSPNFHHLPAAQAALASGIAVLCDKPVTATLAEAHLLKTAIDHAGLPFGITYTYSGYPMVREARARIAAGAIGEIRKVVVEYPQGWLAGSAEGKQAEWRIDPARAGEGGCIADIGTHAFHLAEFVTGLRVTRLLADLAAVVPGRQLDDDVAILLRFDNQARGVLLASQIETGELNGLRIRVYGDKGGLVWRQDDQTNLALFRLDGSSEIIRAGTVVGDAAQQASRTPGGHPEGYLEAFANIYRDFACQLRGTKGFAVPGIDEGLRGMAFVNTAVAASRDACGWVKLEI
jgi:predicted dehydrogenase